MKVLILDSGILINFAMNGLLDVLENLKKSFDGKFIITKQVKYETIDKPVNIQRFEFEALEIKDLLDKKILELPDSLGISEAAINKRLYLLMETANHLLNRNNEPIKIVSEAEMSCLALSTLLSKKGIKNIIGIDERTTRILAEKPENLEKIMEKKLHIALELKEKDFSAFKNFKFIRSAEIAYVAYKKGLIKMKDPRTLEAVLYATKFKGSSISWDEIRVLKRL